MPFLIKTKSHEFRINYVRRVKMISCLKCSVEIVVEKRTKNAGKKSHNVFHSPVLGLPVDMILDVVRQGDHHVVTVDAIVAPVPQTSTIYSTWK